MKPLLAGSSPISPMKAEITISLISNNSKFLPPIAGFRRAQGTYSCSDVSWNRRAAVSSLRFREVTDVPAESRTRDLPGHAYSPSRCTDPFLHLTVFQLLCLGSPRLVRLRSTVLVGPGDNRSKFPVAGRIVGRC